MMMEWVRVLGVDPGERRIGLAISDPSGTIANPLSVVQHVSRMVDAAAIAQIAAEYNVVEIVIGQAMDDTGQPGLSGRKAARLAEAIRSQTTIPVVLWDESGSTQTARAAAAAMGSKRRRLRSHLDELAATVILQSYLDNRSKSTRLEE